MFISRHYVTYAMNFNVDAIYAFKYDGFFIFSQAIFFINALNYSAETTTT